MAATKARPKVEQATKWAIKLIGVPDLGTDISITNPWEGFWLSFYDPNAFEGLGKARFSAKESDALTFETFQDAKDCWFQQSTVLPIRVSVDGREFENRPLACCDVAIDEIN